MFGNDTSRRLTNSIVTKATNSIKPVFLPSYKPSKKPVSVPTKAPITSIPIKLPSVLPSKRPLPTLKPTQKLPTRKPSFIPTIIQTTTPTKMPVDSTNKKLTYRPTSFKGCVSGIDFSGSTSNGVVSGDANCRTITFPLTSKQISLCGYQTTSPQLTDSLWQVGYFNTLYSGGIGLESCPYHDICTGYMIQINVSGIVDLGNPRFSMISTPVSTLSGRSMFSIYGSKTAGVRGTELLYTNQTLNNLLPLPGVQTFNYLSIVTSSLESGPSGLLLQKLKVTVPCLPTSTPSYIPSFIPSLSPSTVKPSRPTRAPVIRPSYGPTNVPTSPTSIPTLVPSAPTQTPTTIELKSFEELSFETYSSRPVLMHQFQFLGALSKYISTDCQQYVVDKIQNTTASICNNIEIRNNKVIFQPSGPPVPYIQINNIVELSNVNVFSIATWLTLGKNDYNDSFPLFSIGDITFPFSRSELKSSSSNHSLFPYEPLGCYSQLVSSKTMTVLKIPSIKNLTACRGYAYSKQFNYFAYGSSFCRFVIIINSLFELFFSNFYFVLFFYIKCCEYHR